MSNTTYILDRAETVRKETLAIFTALIQKTGTFELPSLPPVLELHRRKLEANKYQVLVVGEAKRGKSTFVNAMIGRSILPTDVDVATSQVFRVRNAEQETYRLCFEDDSQQEIALADLPRYGSQVVADTQGPARLDQIIRWIEVDVPAKFLPQGLSILDTPGLGTLYAAHAQITHRLVPHADAVIFVLDSQSPIGEPEVTFLEEILKVTHSIFFIQTRIDQVRRDAWQAVQERNQDILKDRFNDRLDSTHVWPLSSTNLFKAAVTGDDDYLIVSRHKDLEPALKAFLFRIVGWSRSATAILAADGFHQQSLATLEARRKALLQDPTTQQNRRSVQITQRRQQLERDWGDQGKARRELLQAIKLVADQAQQYFRQALQPGCIIEVEQQDRIDATQSTKEAKQLAEEISAQVVTKVASLWQETAASFRSSSLDRLRPLLQDTQMDPTLSDGDSHPLAVRKGSGLDLDSPAFHKAITASEGLLMGTASAAVVGQVLCVLIGASWFPPVAIVGVISAGLWGAYHGWHIVGASHLKTAQQDLHKHLGDVLQRVRQHYLGDGTGTVDGGLISIYFRDRLNELTNHVADIAERKLGALQHEIAFQTAQDELNESQRKTKADDLGEQLAEWDQLGDAIRIIKLDLQELDTARIS